jgi:hypothetical protein
MTGTVLFAGLTNAVAVAMVQWSVQHCVVIVERSFKKGDCH